MSALTPQPTWDIVGTVLNGKYQVQQRLSQGGMGVVYKAHHLMLDAPVALKVLLKPESEEAQHRFLSEARLASKIRHPNTVYIADFGVLDDGRAFLEMEFLDGRTLGGELSKGPIELLRACQITMQMARGLQAVHDKGIIHRDMKPDNVFLMEQDGSKDFVKIVDFGIAKAAQRDSPSGPSQAMSRDEAIAAAAAPGNLTQMGMVLGTPGFMAPEQIQGLRINFQADQYSLGCILYEMITGQPVFTTDSTSALMMTHLAAAPKPLRERCPALKVPKTLDDVVLRLLAKEPAHRYASMRAVEQALQIEIDRLLQARGLRSTGNLPLAGPRRVQLFGKQVPLWGLTVPLVVVLLGLGVVGGRWLLNHKPGAVSTNQQSRELLELRQRAITILRQDLLGDVPALRYAALAALGQTGDGELRGDLEAVLSSLDAQTRAQAAAALGRLGDRRAIPALVALLGSAAGDQQQVRVAAADALRQLGESRGARFLEQTLDGSDQDAQLRAALFFCAQGPADVQRILGAYMQRSGLPDATMLSILGCLARAGSPAALAQLQRRVTEVGPPEVRLAAAVKLAQLGEGQGLAYLRELVYKRSREQLIAARELAQLDERDGLTLLREVAQSPSAPSLGRQLGCDGLAGIGEPADARQLATLLADKETNDPALRQAAARAVVRIAGRDPVLLSQQSLSWAQTALGDSDALVRQSAAAILGDNLNGGAVSLLAGLLKDADPRVRRSAVTALGRRRDEGALAALRSALQDADKGVRIESLRSLLAVVQGTRPPSAEVTALRQALTALLARLPAAAAPGEHVLAAGVLWRLGDDAQLKQLQKWLTAPEPELRRLALEQLTLSVDELVALLSDKAGEVRYLAARKLAELRDRRAAPVLRELVALHGAESAGAYALLLRLGVETTDSDPLLALLASRDVNQRVAALESLRERPATQALPLLQKTARDVEMLVRWTTAEVAASLLEQPDGAKALPILLRLSGDADPMVRARAAALLSRVTILPKASPDPAPPAATKAAAETSAANQSRDGGTGAAPGEVPPPNPVGTSPPEAAPSAQIEALVHAGLDSFARNDYKKAQRQLSKALTLCSHERGRGGPCTTLSFDILYRLGSIHEQQKALPEAMSEYQQVAALIPQVRGRADIKAAVQTAIARLAPRLGQVVVTKRGKRGCQEEQIWLRPGTHSIRVDSKFEQIEVKPRESVRVGACK